MISQGQRIRATVISAVHERRMCQSEWLEAVTNQSTPADDFEVILVDAASAGDEYHQVFDRFDRSENSPSNFFYHRIEPAGRARALNYSLGLARGEVIIFLADDFVVTPKFVEAHLTFHVTHPEDLAVGIGGGVIPDEMKDSFSAWLEGSGKFFGIPFSREMTEVPSDFFYVGNASVKRGFLDRVGWFNELYPFHCGDDFELGQRLAAAGMRSKYVADAIASHPHPVDLPERERAARDLGESAARIAHAAGRSLSPLRKLNLSIMPRFRVLNARLRFVIHNDNDALASWWSRRLEASFADGYREGFAVN